jgi:hypothetical protein
MWHRVSITRLLGLKLKLETHEENEYLATQLELGKKKPSQVLIVVVKQV